MEAFLFSLLGMLIGGVSVMAYRHYDAFPKVFNVLFYGSFGLFILVSIWDIGLIFLGTYLRGYLEYEAWSLSTTLRHPWVGFSEHLLVVAPRVGAG